MSWEIWLPVVGYEGWYEVSSHGRVVRVKKGQGCRVGKCLRTAINETGYHRLALTKNGKGKTYFLHVLVANTFLGPRPPGHEVNHIDADKNNNASRNLEYVTRIENVLHAAALGLVGGKYGSHKLSDSDVREIRLNAGKESNAAVAKRHGVDRSVVSRIISGHSHKHLL